jgi:hypothetical protein
MVFAGKRRPILMANVLTRPKQSVIQQVNSSAADECSLQIVTMVADLYPHFFRAWLRK